MDIYRISKEAYINDLSGTGAQIYGGRWNTKGYAVLYTAGSRSLAALETLVHLPQKNLPDDLRLLQLSFPDNIRIKTIQVKDLPAHWRTITLSPFLQEIGNQWINENKYLIMKVPSVVIPEEHNYLINPAHKAFDNLKSVKPKPFRFDKRLNSFVTS